MIKTSRNILIIIFVLAIVIAAAISWYATKPEEDVDLYAKAVARLAQTKSFVVELELETFFDPSSFMTEGGSGLLGSIDVPLRISGPVALSYPRGGLVTGQAKLDFSAGFGIIKLMELDTLVAADGRLYARARNLPDDLGSALDVQSLNETWFSVGGQDLMRLMPKIGTENDWSGATAAIQSDELRSALADWLIPYRRYQDTIISGHAVAHYEMLIDRDRLTNLLAVIIGVMRGRPCSEAERATILAGVNSRRLMAETWIDKVNNDLSVITLGIFPLEDEGVVGMPIALTLTFKSFELPVELQVPTNTSPLSAVLMRVLRVPAANIVN
ncbi:hypothetical protein KKF05_01355 [Patescibacteria group bacterium]|nr:hypothetical protein [Patescibacteria group bacterium]MBU1029167.1 hypothetical protein [Patescibacteria group bacterium]MBU1916155.1 hypothetical protein [Patescibacteria group bacterium]